MSSIKLFEINPMDDEQYNNLVSTSIPDVVVNYCDKFRKQEQNEDDNNINRLLFLKENDMILGVSSIEGYKDSKNCLLDLVWFIDKSKDNGIMLKEVTNYMFDKFNMETINISINSDDKEMINVAISNQYEMIDFKDKVNNYVKENPRRIY